MKARLLAFIVWAAVAASAMFWLLRLAGGGIVAPAHTVSVSGADTPRGDWSRLFVMAAPASAAAAPVQDPAAASRFNLVGVAAPRWAVIAVDGKPPRSVALGAAVDAQWIVQSIENKQVAIGPRGEAAVVTLALATLPPAATGILPPLSGIGMPAVSTVPLNRPGAFPAPSMPGLPSDAMAPSAILHAPPKLPGSNAGDLSDESNSEAPPAMPTLQR